MIDDIIQIFKDNQNKWMTYKEVFNVLNERNFNWGPNIKGSIGHKNIVSRELSERHRSKFEVDKSFRPQKYRLKDFNNKEIESEISIDLDINDNDGEDEITEFVLDIDNLEFEEYDSPSGIEIREPSVKIKEKGRKINYDKKNRRNKKKGDIGEEAVVVLEKNKLMKLGRGDLSEQVEWVSKEKGDGLGYDIISWNVKDGEWNKIYIELKTTEGNINTPFDISDTEVRVSEKLAENYYIYRVFGIGSVISRIKYYRIKGSVKEKFNLIPILYKAYLKTNDDI